MNKNNRPSSIETLINKDIIPIVKSVRDNLGYIYDTDNPNSYHTNFTGLCDVACCDVKEILLDRLKFKYDITTAKISIIHGEQRHTPLIKSLYWWFEHTWLELSIGDKKVYIDPTSSQFKDLYNDIPDYYVSLTPPKWYLPDSKNPIFSNKILCRINNKFHVRVMHDCDSGYTLVGIIEYIYYELWAELSDVIHKLYK